MNIEHVIRALGPRRIAHIFLIKTCFTCLLLYSYGVSPKVWYHTIRHMWEKEIEIHYILLRPLRSFNHLAVSSWSTWHCLRVFLHYCIISTLRLDMRPLYLYRYGALRYLGTIVYYISVDIWGEKNEWKNET